MYAIAPAAIGFAAGALLPLQAWRELASDEARTATRPPFLLLAALPASGLALAVVATALAASAPDVDLTFPLLALGGAALAQGLAQGLVARSLLPRLVDDPMALAPGLVRAALPEALTVGAFAWVLVARSGGLAP